jgi:hypothetical protein
MPDRHVDERLVADVARSLRGDAGLPYSARQLWYAVCERLEPPHATQATAQIAAGVLLIAVGVVFGIIATVFVAAVIPVGMVILGLGLQRRRFEQNRPTSRVLALSYDAFVRETLDPMRARAGTALEGLLAPDADADADGATDDSLPLVVCDRPETAAVVAAIAAAAALGIEVTDELRLDAPPPGRRIHTLHDADPRGCALPVRLAAAGAGDVVDIGLRPGHITGRRLQIIEGAPAVVTRELSGLLTADEIVWLADGRRVELAVLSPAVLVEGLQAALAASPVEPPGAAPATITLAGASPVPAVSVPGAIPPDVEG